MTDTTDTTRRSNLGALLTTGFVAAVLGFCASVLYFKAFPPVDDKPLPIVIVDMVKLSHDMTVAQKDGNGAAFATAAHAVSMLKEQGYIVLDSRMVLDAPDMYFGKLKDI